MPKAAPALPHAEWLRLRAGWTRVGLDATAVLLRCCALAGVDRAFRLLPFAARRRAQRRIRREFRAQRIGFALPTVQVSGDASDGAAAQGASSVVGAPEATAAE